jgi:curved DNA-binding protein
MEYKDYYKTLGVSKNADQKEIKKAFRKLARQYHPDVNKGDKEAENRFKEINEAYEVLSDPDKRQKYDQFGSQWQQFARAGGHAQDFDWSQWSSQPGSGGFRSVSPEEFEQMFGGSGGFSDFFETLFGGTGGRRAQSGGFGRQQTVTRRGQDQEHAVQITLEEVLHGTTRTLQWEDGRKIEAKIPKGVKSGSKIRLSGQGGSGSGGGPAGDLYLVVETYDHPSFDREDSDLRVSIPVDLYTALLGGKVEVPTLEGSVNLTIPAGTGNGQTIRLRGQGLPHLREPNKRGDLFAVVNVQLPQNLTQEEKTLFEQLRTMRQQAQ